MYKSFFGLPSETWGYERVTASNRFLERNGEF